MNFRSLIMVSMFVVVAMFVAGVAWAENSCSYNGVVYSQGSFACQGGYGYKCASGSWEILNTACSTQPHDAGQTTEDVAKGVCACSKDERNLCYAKGQVCETAGNADKCEKKCK